MEKNKRITFAVILIFIAILSIYGFYSRDKILFKEENIVVKRKKDDKIIVEENGNKLDLGLIKDDPLISMSPNKLYLVIKYEDVSLILNLKDNLKEIKLKNIEGPIFSPEEDKMLVAGKNGQGNFDLAIYYLNSDKLESLLEGLKGQYFIPLAWDKNIIKYKLIDKGEEGLEELDLTRTREDKIVDILKEDGNYNLLLKYMKDGDRKKLKADYGEDILIRIFEWLTSKDINDLESIKLILDLDADYSGNEHYAYMDLLAKVHLSDIVLFSKALVFYPEKAVRIGYGFNDIKLYEREERDMLEDIKAILHSNSLTEEEKQLGLRVIDTYASCGG